MEKKTRKKSNIVNMQYVIYGIIAFLIVAVALYIFIFLIPKDVEIPNIVGLERSQAEEVLKKSRLHIGKVIEEYSSMVEKGYIISQDPQDKEDETIKQNSAIDVVISLGSEEITTVPKVIGMTKDEAIIILENANLKYKIIEESSEMVQAGYVISQEFVEGKEVVVGTTVTIYVSTGEEIE